MYIHAHHPAHADDSERDREGFKEMSASQTQFRGDAFSGSAMGAGMADGDDHMIDHESGVHEQLESPVLGRKEGA